MAEDELSRYRERILRLKAEKRAIVKRQRELELVVSNTGADEELVARLMSDNAVAVLDPATQLRMLADGLDTNARAQAAISKAIGALELREGYKRCAPLFERAVRHAEPLARALAQVERILLAADSDLREFEAASNAIAGLQSQRLQSPPYDERQLAALRFWRLDFLGDGSGLNQSRLDHWRDLLAEVGLLP
jgi:hypothetical protein